MKNKSILSFASLVCIFTFCTPTFAKQAQIIHILEIAPIEAKLTIDVETDFLCQDVQWLSLSGEPRVPWKVVNLLLPPDAVLDTIDVALKHAQYEKITGEWNVSPQPPVALMKQDENKLIWPKGKNIVEGRDVDIYGKDSPWPDIDIRLIHVGQMRKWNLAQIAVPLIKYNPVKRNLKKLTSGQIELYFERTAILYDDPKIKKKFKDRLGKDTVCKIAANYEHQKDAYVQAELHSVSEAISPEDILLQEESGPAPGYVIITTSEIQSVSQELSNFVFNKQLKGFDVEVITEVDFGGGVGDVAAENIRTWLQSHYFTDNIQYVLLIGNPHPTQGEIPMKMTYPRNNETELPEYKDSPTDFYYADLTGNWDLDGDGYYGEWGDDFGTGGVDRNWEVLVGRIPCYPEPNSPTEQGKVLYDSGPPNRGNLEGDITYLGWTSGYMQPGYEQRWSAHPFTIPEGTWDITQINADYFIGDDFDLLDYIIWQRNGQECPVQGDELIQGTIASPVSRDDPRLPQTDLYLHQIEVDFQLEGGDYYLTIYGRRSDGQPGSLAWLGNTENGIPLLNPSSNPNPGVDAFFWRSAQFPNPGFAEYNLPKNTWDSLPGQEPNQLYTVCFTIFGNEPNSPGDELGQPLESSAFDPNDLDHILSKIITYENTPQSQTGWRRNVLLPMKSDYGDQELTYHLGECIKEQIIDKQSEWDCFRIYDQNYSLDPVPDLIPCTKENVTTTWANSPFGLVVWNTHGWEIGASYVMDVDHADMLNDDYPAFTFQASCLTAHPETSYNLAYSLLKNGGICTIGATRVSWGIVYLTSFFGQDDHAGFAAEYTSRLIENSFDAGHSLFSCKQGLVPTQPTLWMNYTDFNIYGCPALAISSYQSDGMIINPMGGFESSGNTGGPFVPNSQSYTVTNTSDQIVEYQVTKSKDWISLNGVDGPIIGSLDPNETTDITIQLTSDANDLPAGSYYDSIEFANLTTGIGNTTRPIKFRPEIIYDGVINLAYADCLAVDHLGNLYIAGNDAYLGLGSRVSKLNYNGVQFWEYDFQGLVYPDNMSCDHLGNLYISGYYSGTVDLDPTDGEDWYSSGQGFIIKMSRDGTYVWSYVFDASVDSMVCDPEGAIIVGGSNFISKLDSNGDIDWTYTFSNININGIDCDTSGNIIATGDFNGTADFDPTDGIDSHTSNGYDDIFITRYSREGNYVSTFTIGDSYDESGEAVAVGRDGDIFIIGAFSDFDPGTMQQVRPYIVDFDPTEGIDLKINHGGNDIFITKLSPDYNYLWTKIITTPGYVPGDWIFSHNESPSGIAFDGSGNILVTGAFYCCVNVDFDPTYGSDLHTSRGGNDGFITRLDSDGNYHWTGFIGGSDADYCAKAVVDHKGNIFIAGTFQESADLDPTDGEDWNSCGSNRRSGFVAKIKRGASPVIVSDADHDGDVDFNELYLLVSNWLDTTCTIPDWCENTDFNHSTKVDLEDFALLARFWMENAP